MPIPPKWCRCLLLAAAIFCMASPAQGQVCKNPPYMLIVLDSSGSMMGSKWTSAKSAIGNLLSANSGVLFGLMYFSGSCFNSVSVPCAAGNSAKILSSLATHSPGGLTELGGALKTAGTYLTGLSSKKSKYVLVITDGCTTNSCGNYKTETAALMAKGIKTFVVGFGSGVCTGQLSDIAQAGGTKTYYQANNSTQLTAALKAIGGITSCCGNGLIDKGEKCDTLIPQGQPGACPKTCKDSDPCTKDLLSGNLCTRVCTHSPITSAVNNDGCCPPGATSATDSDCPGVCGNGVVDKGEKCDTLISAGSPGACPTSCSDGDPCTKDLLIGTKCNKECSYPAITQAVSGDGCCPPGSSSLTDSDCPSICGNGILDKGEKCDPGIKAGPGKCKTLADCKDNDPCTPDGLTGSGCDVRCKTRQPDPDLINKDGCCPKGKTYLDDADCPRPCGPDRQKDCIDLCKGMKCPPGEHCKYGKCYPASSADIARPGRDWSASVGDGAAAQGNPESLDEDSYGPSCSCELPPARAVVGAWPVLLALALLSLARRRG